jgi:hypothetical protein
METERPDPEQPLANLRALASELRSLGLAAEVRGTETLHRRRPDRRARPAPPVLLWIGRRPPPQAARPGPLT